MPNIKAFAGTVFCGNDGRARVKCENHSEFGTRWVKRPHLVWWKHKHQRVSKGFVLHHRDFNPSRDVISNLRLMTISAHTSLHANQRHLEGRFGTAAWTKESHVRASNSHIGNTALLGFKFSAESKLKMSKSRIGKRHTKLTKSKMRNTWARRREEKLLFQSGYGHPWRLKDLARCCL